MSATAIARIAWIGPLPQGVGELPWAVESFADGDDFLLSAAPFGHDAYVVSAAQAGLATTELLALVRARSAAPLLLLDAPGLPALAAALQAGADMVLPEAADAGALKAALGAIARRGALAAAQAEWVVSDVEQALLSPRGVQVRLSEAEHGVMLAFTEAQGGAVTRAALAAQIWGPDSAASDNALHATIYRLRRRVEDECGDALPIRSQSRLGYSFDAPVRRGR